MNNDIYFYFFLTGILFAAYFVIITIFGNIILSFYKTKVRKKENPVSYSFLEQTILSFGIGVSIYLSLSYVLDIFEIFNFYYAYLTIILIDIIYLSTLLILNRDDINLKESIQKGLRKLTNRDTIISLIIVIFVIGLAFYIQWRIIIRNHSLLFKDPYLWVGTTQFLLDNGHIDYNWLPYRYPSGYNFFTGGCLLVFPEFQMIYYFVKTFTVYMISLYIIIAFTVLKRIFQKKSLVFIGLLLIIISRYFFYRMIPYLSSSLASFLFTISFIVIIAGDSEYLISPILAAVFLINPLVLFFIIFAIALYLVLKIFTNLKNRQRLLAVIKSILLLIIGIFLVLLPYILNFHLKADGSIIELISSTFRAVGMEFPFNSQIEDFSNFNLLFLFNQNWNFSLGDFLKLGERLLNRTINVYFFFSFGFLFLYLRKKNSKNRDIQLFSKSFIIILITIAFIPFVIPSWGFLSYFWYRIIEPFTLAVIIGAIFGLEYILIKFRKVTITLVDFIRERKGMKGNTNHKLTKYNKFVYILLLSLIATSIMGIREKTDPPINYYWYDNEITEMFLYIGENAQPGSTILAEELDPHSISAMINNMDVIWWNLTKNSTFSEFNVQINNVNPDYLIFTKNYFNNSTIFLNVSESGCYQKKLENKEYILFFLSDIK